MRRVIASEFVSLDGVMESPDQWHFPYFNDEMGEAIGAAMAQADAMLMGRVLYEEWAAYWPHQDPEENPVAVRMNGYPPKHVASTTLQEPLEWNNSTIIKSNVAEEVEKLKQQEGKDILVFGSADLMNTLMRHDLVDELRLMVFPVVVGKGKRLFDDGEDGRILELVDSKSFGTGGVSLAYRLERS
jgi:dihydrofolate reductase